MPKEEKKKELKTSAEAEAAAPGKDTPLAPPPLPGPPKPKDRPTQATALAACKAAGIKKLHITVDVETACLPAEASKGAAVQFKAQVGEAFVPFTGGDIVEGIQLVAERVRAHPPQQNQQRTFEGNDPTAADRKVVGG